MVDLVIARRWLRDQHRALLGWSLGSALLVLITIATYPSFRDNPELAGFVEDLPEFMRAVIGDEFTSPAGYLGARVFSTTLPILLIVYLVGRGANAIAGDERDGRLELLLVEPVTRRRVVLERAAAALGGGVAIGVATWLAVVVGGAPVGLDVPLDQSAAAVIASLLLALVHGGVALAVGASTGSKGAATGAASALAFGGWLLYGLAPLVDAIDRVAWLSPWHHALEPDPIRDGFDPAALGVLTALVAVTTVAAVVGFDRRDVGT